VEARWAYLLAKMADAKLVAAARLRRKAQEEFDANGPSEEALRLVEKSLRLHQAEQTQNLKEQILGRYPESALVDMAQPDVPEPIPEPARVPENLDDPVARMHHHIPRREIPRREEVEAKGGGEDRHPLQCSPIRPGKAEQKMNATVKSDRASKASSPPAPLDEAYWESKQGSGVPGRPQTRISPSLLAEGKHMSQMSPATRTSYWEMKQASPKRSSRDREAKDGGKDAGASAGAAEEAKAAAARGDHRASLRNEGRNALRRALE
jgi:hypothetical protein